MANYYDPEDQQLLATATALLDQLSFDEAHRVLSARIAQNLTTSDQLASCCSQKLPAS